MCVHLLLFPDSLRFAETFNAKQQDMYKCIARCHVARNRFLQILRREHYVTQKFQENAQMNPCDDQSNIQEKIQKLQMRNVYEAGKLNLLTIIQLLNEVLKVMTYEHCKADQARLILDLHYLEKEAKLQRERLSDMKHMRHKIKENVTAIRHSVFEKEGKWHQKWKEFLGLSPFGVIKGGSSVSTVDLEKSLILAILFVFNSLLIYVTVT
ncbi:hypothetical protein U0070_007550 [Myodes glareolus]|uniref:Uncharacterized protein n=1 Tax=Myodes glareolus TaxID=447135 RepID=A0AAW0J100_MYOGA